MTDSDPNMLAGWLGIFGGIASGAVIGLLFHREEWLGGYGSHARRLVRLGHISFFGLGFLNIFFALSVQTMSLSPLVHRAGSIGMQTALIAMPICCFLTAWRKPFRHLFPIPVIAATVGTVAVLIGALR